ncbi:MAG: alpha/beta fold hydrolase [Candidatus Binataceae bacterium]
MNAPARRFVEGAPRLHYLEWNPAGTRTIVLLHGNSANAWWWEPVAGSMPADTRLIALDLRGHGDSEWVRPAAYSPHEYAEDLRRTLAEITRPGDALLVVGHSMGGLAVLAYATRADMTAQGIVAIDVAIVSNRRRDHYLRRLKSLPTVTYADVETAKARFRLIPNEGQIDPELLARIAERSLMRTDDGRYTYKFDRESFFGSDGISVLDTIRQSRLPTLLIRAERSRIMTAEAAARALGSNPKARLIEIPNAAHHILLERPGPLAQAIIDFAESLGR